MPQWPKGPMTRNRNSAPRGFLNHVEHLSHWDLGHWNLIRISDFGFRIFHLPFLLLALLPTSLLALTPATLVGPDLQPRTVNVESLSDGVLSFFDTDRQLK